MNQILTQLLSEGYSLKQAHNLIRTTSIELNQGITSALMGQPEPLKLYKPNLKLISQTNKH